MDRAALANIPGVDALVRLAAESGAGPEINSAGHTLAVTAAREVVDHERSRLLAGESARAYDELVRELAARVSARLRSSLRPVINATGVILQTNLGRAPLSRAAIEAMERAAAGYTNLEFEIENGRRGSRHEHVRTLLREATGAEDGIVVNNNAAALFMALQVFAAGRDVIVSRGQAVEIGGGFRIPDVLRQSGARLVEVGTTNRTYARDYQSALSHETAAILRVHASNFRVVGFTATPTLEELGEVARGAGTLLMDDLGSGCLLPTERWGMAHEPMVQESVAHADLVLFSGDKLLGGPQAGIIAGRGPLIEQLRRHPLARALRVDKLTVAALNATLDSYVRGAAQQEIPVWRMLSLDDAALAPRAAAYAAAGGGRVIRAMSLVGGGSLPGEGVEGPVASLRPPNPTAVAAALRAHEPPVLGHIDHDLLILDPRTVDPGDDSIVTSALRGAIDNANQIDR